MVLVYIPRTTEECIVLSKKIEYTSCDHFTCNSCARERQLNNLNHHVCGVCFPDLASGSPPPGDGYRGQVGALRPAEPGRIIITISSDTSVPSDTSAPSDTSSDSDSDYNCG